MTPRKRRAAGGWRAQRNEAARLTEQLLDAGFNKKQVGEILGRNPSLVSQFFTKNKGASMVEALRAVVQEVQAGGPRDITSLKALAGGYVQPRLNKAGYKAKVRGKTTARSEKTVKDKRGRVVIGPDGKPVRAWSSSLAKAGKQHIASGASRLRPVVEDAAKFGGKIAFTVRAKKGSFTHDAGRAGDSPGLRRNVVQRRDGIEERAYANNTGAPDPAWKDSTPSSSRPWSTLPAATSPQQCRRGSSTTTASSQAHQSSAWKSAPGSQKKTESLAGQTYAASGRPGLKAAHRAGHRCHLCQGAAPVKRHCGRLLRHAGVVSSPRSPRPGPRDRW
ncbi:hypothetical protein AB0I75_32555 [Streptomyces sp. NPDC050273]|uniref:hypothetical protein n=1 Tax=Streptomyces sp. NPDC050273 TaxID=3154933 RepID=UPI00343D33BB